MISLVDPIIRNGEVKWIGVFKNKIALLIGRAGRVQMIHRCMYKKKRPCAWEKNHWNRCSISAGHMYNEATGREVLGKR